jgi:hypothetical protein
MEVDLDESEWPIVVARWKRSVLEVDLSPLLARIDEWLSRRTRFGLLIDARGAGGLSPDQRAQVLIHMRANAALTKEWLVQATVIDNLVQRTLFYGVNLLFPNPFPSKVFGDVAAARRWLEGVLAESARAPHAGV